MCCLSTAFEERSIREGKPRKKAEAAQQNPSVLALKENTECCECR